MSPAATRLGKYEIVREIAARLRFLSDVGLTYLTLDRIVRGDFEGITFVNGRICLTDSNGVLYLAAAGADYASGRANRIGCSQ